MIKNLMSVAAISLISSVVFASRPSLEQQCRELAGITLSDIVDVVGSADPEIDKQNIEILVDLQRGCYLPSINREVVVLAGSKYSAVQRFYYLNFIHSGLGAGQISNSVRLLNNQNLIDQFQNPSTRKALTSAVLESFKAFDVTNSQFTLSDKPWAIGIENVRVLVNDAHSFPQAPSNEAFEVIVIFNEVSFNTDPLRWKSFVYSVRLMAEDGRVLSVKLLR